MPYHVVSLAFFLRSPRYGKIAQSHGNLDISLLHCIEAFSLLARTQLLASSRFRGPNVSVHLAHCLLLFLPISASGGSDIMAGWPGEHQDSEYPIPPTMGLPSDGVTYCFSFCLPGVSLTVRMKTAFFSFFLSLGLGIVRPSGSFCRENIVEGIKGEGES